MIRGILGADPAFSRRQSGLRPPELPWVAVGPPGQGEGCEKEDREVSRCVTCGRELHPERAEKYEYCTQSSPGHRREDDRGRETRMESPGAATHQTRVSSRLRPVLPV